MTYNESRSQNNPEVVLTPRGRAVLYGVVGAGSMALALGIVFGAKGVAEEIHDMRTVDPNSVEIVVSPNPNAEEGGMRSLLEAHIDGRISQETLNLVDRAEMRSAVARTINDATGKNPRVFHGSDIATVYVEDDGDIHSGVYLGTEPYLIDGNDVKFADSTEK